MYWLRYKNCSSFFCQDLIRDETPFTVHCCHQLCCKKFVWRLGEHKVHCIELNGCCKHKGPTHVPLIFEGSSEFLSQLRRISNLSNIAGRVKETTTATGSVLSCYFLTCYGLNSLLSRPSWAEERFDK